MFSWVFNIAVLVQNDHRDPAYYDMIDINKIATWRAVKQNYQYKLWENRSIFKITGCSNMKISTSMLMKDEN